MLLAQKLDLFRTLSKLNQLFTALNDDIYFDARLLIKPEIFLYVSTFPQKTCRVNTRVIFSYHGTG